MTVAIGHETILIERGTLGSDGLGNRAWTFPGTRVDEVSGCSVQPGAHTLQDVGQDLGTVVWTVWLPGYVWDMPPRAFRVTLPSISPSQSYQLVATPQIWRSPSGQLDHHVIYLEAFE